MRARDARAWAIIALAFIAVLVTSNTYATTGTGYTRMAIAATITLALILAWARRRHIEETRS